MHAGFPTGFLKSHDSVLQYEPVYTTWAQTVSVLDRQVRILYVLRSTVSWLMEPPPAFVSLHHVSTQPSRGQKYHSQTHTVLDGTGTGTGTAVRMDVRTLPTCCCA